VFESKSNQAAGSKYRQNQLDHDLPTDRVDGVLIHINFHSSSKKKKKRLKKYK
jgi:hypothetical protein